MKDRRELRVAGLFAGIGGIELGFDEAGMETELLCEIDPHAQRVLVTHFPHAEVVGDVTTIVELPPVEVVTAGFPCQDLSQAGRTAGIRGNRSSLVEHVFRLLDEAAYEPTWLVLENVPFMLRLDKGEAMDYLVQELERRGFRWAYRIVDTHAFGLPQRRHRVLLVASKTADPRGVLFADDAARRPDPEPWWDRACGFYWTEGLRGLGWGVDCVPPLKGGSTIGIPSPPAIVLPDEGGLVTPSIRDAERLQGFPADWTLPATEVCQRGERFRWRLVGNAVSVPVASWLGKRLMGPGDEESLPVQESEFIRGLAWPKAAWGGDGRTFEVEASAWPICCPHPPLAEFLQFETKPLSTRATAGFFDRAQRGNLRFPEGFLLAVERHLQQVSEVAVPA